MPLRFIVSVCLMLLILFPFSAFMYVLTAIVYPITEWVKSIPAPADKKLTAT